MTTALYRHQLCLLHDAGPGHPENPARLQAIEKQLEKDRLLEQVRLPEPPVAQREQLAVIHDPAYVDRIFSTAPASGLAHLDGDTAMNPHSLQSALLAAGAVIDATEHVLSGKLDNAFCCMRPPGHHAEHNRAMGFCLFGSIAAGAAYALNEHQLDRVAIVDFDVHHGNGTEDIFRNEPRVLFCSSFQHPFYPYTDISNPGDNVVYSPLPAGSGSSEFRAAIERDWLPALQRQQPQMIFISAGFDAHRDDPLGGLMLNDDDFGWVTSQLTSLAGVLCNGRIVSTLEGGYDADALGRCVSRHLRELIAAG